MELLKILCAVVMLTMLMSGCGKEISPAPAQTAAYTSLETSLQEPPEDLLP